MNDLNNTGTYGNTGKSGGYDKSSYHGHGHHGGHQQQQQQQGGTPPPPNAFGTGLLSGTASNAGAPAAAAAVAAAAYGGYMPVVNPHQAHNPAAAAAVAAGMVPTHHLTQVSSRLLEK